MFGLSYFGFKFSLTSWARIGLVGSLNKKPNAASYAHLLNDTSITMETPRVRQTDTHYIDQTNLHFSAGNKSILSIQTWEQTPPMNTPPGFINGGKHQTKLLPRMTSHQRGMFQAQQCNTPLPVFNPRNSASQEPHWACRLHESTYKHVSRGSHQAAGEQYQMQWGFYSFDDAFIQVFAK